MLQGFKYFQSVSSGSMRFDLSINGRMPIHVQPKPRFPWLPRSQPSGFDAEKGWLLGPWRTRKSHNQLRVWRGRFQWNQMIGQGGQEGPTWRCPTRLDTACQGVPTGIVLRFSFLRARWNQISASHLAKEACQTHWMSITPSRSMSQQPCQIQVQICWDLNVLALFRQLFRPFPPRGRWIQPRAWPPRGAEESISFSSISSPVWIARWSGWYQECKSRNCAQGKQCKFIVNSQSCWPY